MKFTAFMIFGVLSPLLTETLSQELASVRKKRSSEVLPGSSYFYYQDAEYPRDCQEVYEQCEGSDSESGIYLVKPEGAEEPFAVYCNNSIDGGGWTVLQRRMDGSVEFYRDWNGYKHGFGFLNKEFWLGNDKISLLTNQKEYMVRIDLNSRDGDRYIVKYDLFRISDETTKYRLVDLGVYDSSSTTADSMANHRNQSFTTYNRDNDDDDSDNRARRCHGAWWYENRCNDDGLSNLNGLYTPGNTHYKGFFWNRLGSSDGLLMYSEIKIRPV